MSACNYIKHNMLHIQSHVNITFTTTCKEVAVGTFALHSTGNNPEILTLHINIIICHNDSGNNVENLQNICLTRIQRLKHVNWVKFLRT